MIPIPPSDAELKAAGADLLKAMRVVLNCYTEEGCAQANEWGPVYFLAVLRKMEMLDKQPGEDSEAFRAWLDEHEPRSVEKVRAEWRIKRQWPAEAETLLRKISDFNAQFDRGVQIKHIRDWFPGTPLNERDDWLTELYEARCIEGNSVRGYWITDTGGDWLDVLKPRDPSAALAVHDTGEQG